MCQENKEKFYRDVNMSFGFIMRFNGVEEEHTFEDPYSEDGHLFSSYLTLYSLYTTCK